MLVSNVILLAFLNGICAGQALVPKTYSCKPGGGVDGGDPDRKLCQMNGMGDTGDEDNQMMSLAECKLKCNLKAGLWPSPRTFELENNETTVVNFDPDMVSIEFGDQVSETQGADWLQDALDKRLDWLKNERPTRQKELIKEVGQNVHINVSWTKEDNVPKIKRTTDESYMMMISQDDDGDLAIEITAEEYFGARHAIETLSQLWAYDEINDAFIIFAGNVVIEDSPEFRHRGASIDTVRNFVPVEVLQRTIDGLAFNKLNVFHWHLTDTQSFPVRLENPDTKPMAEYGAYSQTATYSVNEIRKLVNYANQRGVRIIPEFDAPSHVGAGWQIPAAKNFTVCYLKEPWYDYCLQPPCGQLNPMNGDMYDFLRKIYAEYFDIFAFVTFHFGGDEVHFGCWNSSEAVTGPMAAENLPLTEEGYVTIWLRFQNRTLSMMREIAGDPEVILWTSTLTLEENLDKLPKDYVIQIWTNAIDKNDKQIDALVKGGYEMIFSNTDALYMDCGFGAHVGGGNNWCSPYKGWQLVYDNDLYKILETHGAPNPTPEQKAKVLGAEVAMWTESISGASFESKLFPRAAALGERLWTNPTTGFYEAEPRMTQQNYRMMMRGIQADAIQPEYCRLNEGKCYAEPVPDPEPEPNPGSAPGNSVTISAVILSVLAYFFCN